MAIGVLSYQDPVDLYGSFEKGREAPVKRQELHEQLLSKHLENQLQQKYGGQLMQAKIGQLQAKAKPGGLSSLVGSAAQVESLEWLKNKYGEDSPQYTGALDRFKTEVNEKKGRTQYFTQNAWLKNMPAQQKSQFYNDFYRENTARTKQGLHPLSERQYAQARNMIPSDEKLIGSALETHLHEKSLSDDSKLLTDVQPGKHLKETQLALLKQQSDTENRKKILYGNQSEQTMNNMEKDVDSMLKYSGLMGTAALGAQKGLSLFNVADKDYQAYHRFVTNAEMLKHQLTQYWGASITPQIQKEIDALTNPRNWHEGGAVVRQKWNTLRSTMKQEINKRKKAVETPTEFTVSNNDPLGIR